MLSALSSKDCDKEDVDSACKELNTNNHKTDPNERSKSGQVTRDINVYNKRQIEALEKLVQEAPQCFVELNKQQAL